MPNNNSLLSTWTVTFLVWDLRTQLDKGLPKRDYASFVSWNWLEPRILRMFERRYMHTSNCTVCICMCNNKDHVYNLVKMKFNSQLGLSSFKTFLRYSLEAIWFSFYLRYLPNTKAYKCIFRYFWILWNNFLNRDHFLTAQSLCLLELFICFTRQQGLATFACSMTTP